MRWSSKRCLSGAVLACLLADPAGCLADTDVDSVLDSVARAYGGRSAIARLEAFRVDGMVQAHLSGSRAQVRRDVASPRKLRVTMIYPMRTEVRILDGDRGWRGDGFHQDEVSGLSHLGMVYQFVRSTVPRSLMQHRENLVSRGERTEGDERYILLHLPWSSDLAIDFWIDERSRRVVRVEGTLSVAQAEMSFATHFDDFRKVEGLLFPYAEENFAAGQHTASTEITDVKFSPDDLGPFAPYSPDPDSPE